MIEIDESLIKQHWASDKVLVSICCTTFNHEKYLRDALDGFLMQKTTFAFEVIVHDDASTDGTTELIIEYRNKFPSIVKPLLQTTNQYSQGKMIFIDFIFPNVQGDYLAICEGDDYWIDRNKLQKQIDCMIQFPQCNISFHPALGLRNNGKKTTLSKSSDMVKIFSVEDVILGGGDFMPTASLVLTRNVFPKLESLYAIYPNPPVWDVAIQFLGALTEGALYIPITASVYRIFSEGSWSEKMQKNKDFSIASTQGMLKLYRELNIMSQGNYVASFKEIEVLNVKAYLSDPRLPRKFREELLETYRHLKLKKLEILYLLFINRVKNIIKKRIGYTAT